VYFHLLTLPLTLLRTLLHELLLMYFVLLFTFFLFFCVTHVTVLYFALLTLHIAAHVSRGTIYIYIHTHNTLSLSVAPLSPGDIYRSIFFYFKKN
jgi:hypothetical protein